MRAWSRWQDWLNVVVAIWLFVSPWIMGVIAVGPAAWSGWVLGILVFAVALWALASPESRAPEWCNLVLGVVVLLAPWGLGFSNLSTTAWSFFISGLIVLGSSIWALSDMGSAGAERMA